MATKIVNGEHIEMSPEEAAAIEAEWEDEAPPANGNPGGAKWQAREEAKLQALLAAARAVFNGDEQAMARAMVAFAEIVLERTHNMLATKVNAILNAIDNGNTLAQVKTAVAAIADAPTYTAAELKQAIRNQIG